MNQQTTIIDVPVPGIRALLERITQDFIEVSIAMLTLFCAIPAFAFAVFFYTAFRILVFLGLKICDGITWIWMR